MCVNVKNHFIMNKKDSTKENFDMIYITDCKNFVYEAEIHITTIITGQGIIVYLCR